MPLHALADLSNVTTTPAGADAPIGLPAYLSQIDVFTPERVTPNCGNGVIDASDAIEAMVSHGGFARLLPGGVYKCSRSLAVTMTKALQLECGNGATVDFTALTAAGGSSAYGLTIGGSQAAAINLAADGGLGALTVSVAPGAAITSGAQVRISSNAIFDPGRTASKIGELNWVVGFNSGTGLVTLLYPLSDSYLTSDTAQIFIISAVFGVEINGLSLLGREGGNYLGGLLIQYASIPHVGDFYCKHFSDFGVRLQDCMGGVIDNPSTEEAEAAWTTGYGVSVMGASRDVLVRGHRSRGMRHSFTTNNTNTAGRYGIPRNWTYRDAVVYSSSKSFAGAGGDAVDTHAATDGGYFGNIRVFNSSGEGLNIEGINVTVENLTVDGCVGNALRADNYTGRDSRYVFKNIQGKNITGTAANLIRVSEHPAITGGNVTGNILSVEVDGAQAEAYTGKVFWYDNQTPAARTATVSYRGLKGDATSVTDLNGQIYIDGASSVGHAPSALINLPAGAIAVRCFDADSHTGGDLGLASYNAGTTTTATAFRFSTHGSIAATGRFRGTVSASASNTATAFTADSGVTGLIFESVEGNAATPNLTSMTTLPWVQSVTIASDAITLTMVAPLLVVVVTTEASAATDNLSTINMPSSAPPGMLVLLRSVFNSEDVTVLGTGNIRLAQTFTSRVLDNSRDSLLLRWDGSTLNEVAFADVGA